MREHNNLYYVFLWDSEKNTLSLKKAKQMWETIKNLLIQKNN